MNSDTARDPGSTSLTRLHRIVAACDAFEADLLAGRAAAVEDHLGGVPESDHTRLLCELLAIELEHRRMKGEEPSRGEYRARFPRDESVVTELFGDPPEFAGETTLSRPVPGEIDTSLDFERPASPRPGARSSGPDASRFRILHKHAHGGLGEVFAAVDAELNRVVALKELRAECADDAESQGRFLVEAEVTGRLEHPGIVPVYSLGLRSGGRPYYAMRFIRGESLKEAIIRFHAETGDDPAARALCLQSLLRRFLGVCHAIEYAHSRGIVHRDLKPANIMLGGFGETLVVDWGLAKPLGQATVSVATDALAIGKGDLSTAETRPILPASWSGGATPTQTGQVMGTPGYMSPEQAAGGEVGTASDVYGLGATLFAILTGRAPLEGLDPVAMLERVRRGDLPSPRSVNRWVDLPLDAICRKAMATRPEDRYGAVRALALDVERWLADEPVAAWPEPRSRRLRRWARRHRTAVTGVALALLAGLAAVATVEVRANRKLTEANLATSLALAETGRAKKATEEALARSEILRREAEDSRKQAELASNFLTEALRSPDPFRDGRTIKVIDVLGAAREKIGKEFTGTDAMRAALLHALGETYLGLGLFDDALALHTEAFALRQAALGSDHPDTLASLNDLAWARFSAGRAVEALPMMEDALKRRTSRLGLEHPDTLTTRNDLATIYRAIGRVSEAVAMHQGTLKMREQILGRDHPETLNTSGNLAVAYRAAGRTAESIALQEDTLRRMTAKFGADNPLTLRSRSNLARAYLAANRAADALPLDVETLRLRESKLGPDHPETLISRKNLASTYWRVGRTAEAIALQEDTVRRMVSKPGPDHPLTADARRSLARGYESLGRWADAEPLRRDVLTCRGTATSPDAAVLSDDLAGLGSNLLRQAKWTEAERVLREGLAAGGKLSPKGWSRCNIMSLLGDALLRQGRRDEAEPLIVPGYEGMKVRESEIPPDSRRLLSDAAERVIRLYESWGRRSKAFEWKARLNQADLPADVFGP